MIYNKYENGIKLTDFDSFDIQQILECGQCFRFFGGGNTYTIIAYGKVLNIIQDDDSIFFYPCSMDEFENIWFEYFDLERDYLRIKNNLAKLNKTLAQAMDLCGGIRILKQDKWECLISFIISQNNRIPQIKKVINNISCKFGKQIFGDYFSFPTLEELKCATDNKLIECKTGFRSKYILDAINKYPKLLAHLSSSNSCDCLRNTLMKINGVGKKVADCTLLFSYAKYEVYPIDVWIKKVSEKIFFNGKKVPICQIDTFAKKEFGDLAGFAQQYLFYYIRNISNNT